MRVSAISPGRISFERSEFRRSACVLDTEIDHLAEAGIDGVLNTFACELSDSCGGEVEGKEVELVGTLADSPTQPGSLTWSTMPAYSKPEASPRPADRWFQGSLNWEGEPMADEDTEAPDSDDADSTGGCSWKDMDAEWGEAMGLAYCWKAPLTP